MNAEIQAAVLFGERLDVDVQSDFQRHHRHRKPPGRIHKNSPNAVLLNLESFFRKEFKAVLDTQFSTYAEVNNNSEEKARLLIYILDPEKKSGPIGII